ncbi:Xre family transcriptional regulator [Streptomyces sp. NBRC 110611]|uniref:helix-turn-helix domain-containing protein n=1 Tax=Streptomyces sp. NBRC 110611 TaxID=1621259 RepID=UPI00085707E5|nr:helix-turn-helix domain-containing protein [Streptomyces sp. NBRC 110611]GAU67618.1 Xre family transcriptional regulator [Streptomyces sp. NBRC 110611]
MSRSDGNEREQQGGSTAAGGVDDQWTRALEEAPAFGKAIGRQLQRVREEKGRTAEDVARTAQQLGLSWHRPTVGQIERGQRALSAVELVVLPLIYGRPLGELLPEGTLWLTPDLGVYDREVRRVLGGDYNPSARALRTPGGWHVKGWSDQTGEELAGRVAQAVTELSERSPWPADAQVRYTQDKPDEAEAKAAKRLGVTPHYVAYAARETWGHGLAAEREVRLRERGDLPEGRRALQSARGHITRALLAELEPVVKAYGGRRSAQSDRAVLTEAEGLPSKGRETDG